MSSAGPGRPLTVALLGGGTVGASVARLLLENARDLEERVGAPVVLTAVAVRDTAKPRPGVPAELVTGDADDAVARAVAVGADLGGDAEHGRTDREEDKQEGADELGQQLPGCGVHDLLRRPRRSLRPTDRPIVAVIYEFATEARRTGCTGWSRGRPT